MNDNSFEAFSTLLRSRRSMREYLPKEVPVAELEAIFDCAGYAPSNCNSQPWKVVVVAGEKAKRVKQALLDTVGKGEFQMDYIFDDSLYTPELKARQQAAGKLLYEAANIGRADKQARNQFMLDNLDFFGSPQAAFFFLPEWAGIREAGDMGMYAQSVMLAMRAKGLGSCPQTILSMNADAVRESLGIDAQHKLLFGLSFGYFDPTRPVNQTRTAREPVSGIVAFQLGD